MTNENYKVTYIIRIGVEIMNKMTDKFNNILRRSNTMVRQNLFLNLLHMHVSKHGTSV